MYSIIKDKILQLEKTLFNHRSSVAKRRHFPPCQTSCSDELWVISFCKVGIDAGLAEVWIKGAKGAGRNTTLENWDTLHTHTPQRECATEVHKGGSVGIGAGPNTLPSFGWIGHS